MFFSKPQDPLRGNPRTKLKRDRKKLPRFVIEPEELTPLRAKALDGFKSAAKGLLTVGAVLWVLEKPNPGGSDIVAAALLAWLYYMGAVFWADVLLRKTTVIRMDTQTICVPGRFGRRRYDRNLEHQFALLLHDKAQEEARELDFKAREAASKGKLLKQKPYYGDSFHVVLVHGGHRRDLLTVYGLKEAAAIVARLQFCDRCLNEAVQMGGGIKQSAADEWNNAPGGLDDA